LTRKSRSSLALKLKTIKITGWVRRWYRYHLLPAELG
jgi:hypothetical protein